MVDFLSHKRYDVNLIYTGTYETISQSEIERDPVRRVVFKMAKFMSKCLCEDLGSERVYNPDKDMLGGANFFDEFDRVIDDSHVTLLIVSKDIKENEWLKWLNQSAYKRQKDSIGLNTIFLAAPKMTREDIIDCGVKFMLVDNVIFANNEPISTDDVRRSKWYQKIHRSILELSGRTTTSRQMSEQAQDSGAMASLPRPPALDSSNAGVLQSEEESVSTAPQFEHSERSNYRSFESPRGDIEPVGARAERRIAEAHLNAPEQATDPEGIDGVLPSATKDGKPTSSRMTGPAMTSPAMTSSAMTSSGTTGSAMTSPAMTSPAMASPAMTGSAMTSPAMTGSTNGSLSTVRTEESATVDRTAVVPPQPRTRNGPSQSTPGPRSNWSMFVGLGVLAVAAIVLLRSRRT